MPDINQILAESPRSCTYGAPLGARNYDDASSPLYVQRVSLDSGGYARDNTYWGLARGEHLYCAFNGEDEEFATAAGTRIYIRARSRAEAIALLSIDYSDLTFKKA